MASLQCQLGPREGQPREAPPAESARWDPPPREGDVASATAPRARVPSGSVCGGSALPPAPLAAGPPPGPAPRPRQPPGQRNFPLDSAGSLPAAQSVPAPSRKLAPPSPQPARGNRGPKPTRRPPAHRVPGRAGPRAGRHSPQGLDGTCPVSLPSSGARAAIRARLPAPPPPLSARWPGERQQVTRHLAKNTGSRRSAPARVRTLRPPPALQPASH